MIFFILSTEKQSVALRKFLHAPKIDFLENLFARFFKGRRPTTLIYVSTQCIMTWFCFFVNPTYHSWSCENDGDSTYSVRFIPCTRS